MVSAGAAAQALHIHQEHGASLQPDPAARGEVRQGLVDGLAGGADQLGQLLLGEAVGDHHAVIGLAAEALREIEDVLGHAAGDVGEDQVRKGLIGLAQAAGEGGQQVSTHLGTLGEHSVQVLLDSEYRVLSATTVAVALRGAGSNRASSPMVSPGPSTASRFSRPSPEAWPTLTLPEPMMNRRSPGSPSRKMIALR